MTTVSREKAQRIGEAVESVLQQAVANQNADDIKALAATVERLWPIVEWAAKQECKCPVYEYGKGYLNCGPCGSCLARKLLRQADATRPA